ncbi:MAG: hypothetical protein U9Q05_10095 [Thermodesulfobacteriota bacterium]|nr:hypothetical protein [Thermodesulfobacteriota bacterium]
MTENSVKRKLRAILSADVKGYSRMMGEDEVGTFHTLSNYLEIITMIIAAHRGRVFPLPGVERASKAWPHKNQADLKLVVDAVRKAGLN